MKQTKQESKNISILRKQQRKQKNDDLLIAERQAMNEFSKKTKSQC